LNSLFNLLEQPFRLTAALKRLGTLIDNEQLSGLASMFTDSKRLVINAA